MKDPIEDVVRRRMTHTDEDYATALQAVRAVDRVMYVLSSEETESSWVEEWVRDQTWTPVEAGVAWLRARPACLHPLMILFPPCAVVRATVPLSIPAAGSVGVVQSWFEPTDEDPEGLVGVAQRPEGQLRAQCSSRSIEVVSFWRGWTHDRMREILAPR